MGRTDSIDKSLIIAPQRLAITLTLKKCRPKGLLCALYYLPANLDNRVTVPAT